MHKITKKISHQHFNDILTVVVIIMAGFILLAPLLPQLTLWWANTTDKTKGFVYITKLASGQKKPVPKDNRLLLPRIHVNERIYEGETSLTLNQGLWRKPSSSTPDKDGNTVIAGHRFAYGENTPFYHLDKIKKGDRFPLYWNGKEYDYEVSKVKIVPPFATYIEKNTKEPTLTLYTCTPLWTANERLVIQAKLLKDIL